MLGHLRRHRWIATFLLAVSPAIGGQVMPMQMAQSCSTAMATQMAMPGMAMPGMAHPASHGSSQAPSHQPAQRECTCASCCFTVAVAAPLTAALDLASDTPAPTRVIAVASTAHVDTFLDRLPDTTAPPRN